MDLGISGRTAVVTGAADGIGMATTAALLAEGVRVVMVDVDQKDLDAAVLRLPDGIETPLTVACDLSSDEAVHDLATTVAELAGEVDILVTASVTTHERGLFHEVGDEGWVQAGAQLLCAVRVTRAFLPALRHGGWGRIVHVGSDEAPPDRAATAALVSLAADLARAHAAEGLLVETLGSSGTPEETAATIVVLCAHRS